MSTSKALALVAEDPWLEPYADDVARRHHRILTRLAEIRKSFGDLKTFAGAHLELGIHPNAQKKSFTYREWAPEAFSLSLLGDFNEWDRAAHPLVKKEGGIWECSATGLAHASRVKVQVIGKNGSHDRIPAFIRRAVQDEGSKDFSGQLWFPEKPYAWKNTFTRDATVAPLIYEAHVGMAQEKEGVGTYDEFRETVLPRIAKDGYNTLQLMAIQEHPYYGSFGYHVSNFFAPSSRFGTPEELMRLIDAAHGLGIAVVMDLVHSHAVKNFSEGLNEFDGSDYQYFHAGGRGHHEGWDSKLFNYGKEEVQRFLLSNLRYWIEEFRFDGFRFDGVTSMLYLHHGMHQNFGHYDQYFRSQIDEDAVTYLALASTLVRDLRKDALLIAEDMSGMPGLCRRVDEGGLGFDYRLGMGIPDFWIKLIKEKKDEDWDVGEIRDRLSNRRAKEKTIAYAESHDQALVGDKTIAFRLMDAEMYWHMKADDPSPIVERGLALHKLIRLITLALGGEAYMNFMGNEFGHPEWIDFPREGNGWSYRYARRQWSLADHPDLKYKYFLAFDRAMISLAGKNALLASPAAREVHVDTSNQIYLFERGGLLFVFNFHPTRSIADYRFHSPDKKNRRIVLDSDHRNFGGFGRIDDAVEIPVQSDGTMSLYLTNRTTLVLA